MKSVLPALLSTIPLLKFSVVLSSSISTPIQAQNQPLLVAAAADLATVQGPLADAFRRRTGVQARFVLGSSGMLARQIEAGAPYDVYLSANEKFVTDLAAAGRLEPGTVKTYALGRLGLWSKSGAARRLNDLQSDWVRFVAIANPAHAPYGVAARQALEKQGLWEALKSRVVYGENVRQALQYAESGNAQAAVTAWSLVFDRGGVLLPEDLHAQIRQTGGVVKTSARPDLARRFIEFLTGEEGARILAKHGFTIPAASARPGGAGTAK